MRISMPQYRWAGGRQTKPLVALFAGILAPLFLFGLLAEDVWEREGFGWDEALLRTIHARATPMLDAVMLFFTSIGAPRPLAVFVVPILVVLLARGRRGDALFAALAFGGATALSIFVKVLFRRSRPALWLSLAPETDYGFPSGHAMASLAIAAILVVILWPTRWRWPALVLGALFTLLVGLSRVYLGVHYPSDVLAAWSASLAWVTGLRLLWSAAWSWPPAPRSNSRTTDAAADRVGPPGGQGVVQ